MDQVMTCYLRAPGCTVNLYINNYNYIPVDKESISIKIKTRYIVFKHNILDMKFTFPGSVELKSLFRCCVTFLYCPASSSTPSAMWLPWLSPLGHWLPPRIMQLAVGTTDSFKHDDVIKWEHFPRYWPFVWGTRLSTVNSPHKGRHCNGILRITVTKPSGPYSR